MLNNVSSSHLTFIDLSLSRIRNFLEKIGNPQDKISNIIHVAGTNGKGSTCATIRAILEGHGYSVNVFTSPHLVAYNERFRIHGKLITNEYLEEIKSRLAKIDGYDSLSVFELTMAIGFVAFKEQEADFTIIEVGLGGRLDASNVVKSPLLSIITTIDYDHQSFLGNTLTQIAYEKAGIIKRGSLAIADYQDKKVNRALKKYAAHMGSTLICGGEDYKITFSSGKVSLAYKNQETILPKLELAGNHQYYNASLAIISCINILKDKFNYNNLPLYLSQAQWAGRLQKVEALYGVKFSNAEVFLDGAHNISGSRVLCNFIESNYADAAIHIFLGMLIKKDLDGFLQNIAALAVKFNAVVYPMEITGHEAYEKEDILNKLPAYNLQGGTFANFKDKLAEINQLDGRNLIVICGSLYLLGEILGDNIEASS
ncbi:MAG: Mur ligase family protein [Alphaproteobacteria bacterium]|nr:Mur ligase family protein [Alphaproteobacteria bacterium]